MKASFCKVCNIWKGCLVLFGMNEILDYSCGWVSKVYASNFGASRKFFTGETQSVLGVPNLLVSEVILMSIWLTYEKI